MELTEPKPKRNCTVTKSLPFPVILKKDGSIKKFRGSFNGFSVVLENPEDMRSVSSMGYFGKGNLSRSFPQFKHEERVQVLRQRQFLVREAAAKNYLCHPCPEKIVVVPDSDSDSQEYFTNLQPKYVIDHSGLAENVWLSLEEAFFLANVVQCLIIRHNNEEVSIKYCWSLFKSADSNFIRNYVVYFYYRSKNWVVKPGLKFGGDFMLYKEGPAFYHASYIVIIEVIDDTGKRVETLTNKATHNQFILGLNRLCETAGKELLICRVTWPKNEVSFEDFSNIQIQEIIVRRWIATQEREDT